MNHQPTNPFNPGRFAFAIRAIAACLNFAMCIALVAAHTIQSDWIAPVTMVPPWLWLVPAIMLIWIARPILSRGLLAMTILIWLGFMALYAEEARSLVRFRSLPEHHQTNQTIRVATLNCNIGNSHAAHELTKYSPDIVLLQESPGRAQLPKIAAELLGENAEWTSAGDTSILSKGKLQVISSDQASHFCHAVVTLADESQADVVSLRLSPPVFQLDFLSGKFWRMHHETRQKHRAQLQAIVDHLNESAVTQNWIIGGDFNLVGGDGSLSPLKPFEDTFYQSGSGWCNTGTSEYPLFRVDQIWVTGNLRSTVNKTFKSEHSDHRMVVVDLLGPAP